MFFRFCAVGGPLGLLGWEGECRVSCDRHRLLRFVPRACPPSALPRSRSGVLCVLFFFWFFGDWSGRAEGSRSEGCSGGRSLVTHTSHTIRDQRRRQCVFFLLHGGSMDLPTSSDQITVDSRTTCGTWARTLDGVWCASPVPKLFSSFQLFFPATRPPPPDHPGSGFFLARRNLHQ